MEDEARKVLVPMLKEPAGIDRLTNWRAPAGSTRRSSGAIVSLSAEADDGGSRSEPPVGLRFRGEARLG